MKLSAKLAVFITAILYSLPLGAEEKKEAAKSVEKVASFITTDYHFWANRWWGVEVIALFMVIFTIWPKKNHASRFPAAVLLGAIAAGALYVFKCATPVIALTLAGSAVFAFLYKRYHKDLSLSVLFNTEKKKTRVRPGGTTSHAGARASLQKCPACGGRTPGEQFCMACGSPRIQATKSPPVKSALQIRIYNR